jgi:hypothetical protein
MSAIVVPSGMLRISREGETDRVVYPVHADGWRQLGWTVHPPELELDEDGEPEYLGVDGEPAELAGDGAVLPPDELDGAPDAGTGEAGVPTVDDGSDGESGPDAAGGPEGPVAVPDFGAMTKAEIIATASADYGVMLDSSQTKAELVAAARGLAAEVAMASAEDQGEGDRGDAEALAAGGGDEPAVPALLL